MIPRDKITFEHLRRAAALIREKGVPASRESTRFVALVDHTVCPPKYLVSVAARLATGKELAPSEFSGGDEANQFLQGFEGIQIQRKVQAPSQELQPWEALLARVRRYRQAPTYMPGALISALELIAEGMASAEDVGFEAFNERFDDVQRRIGDPHAVGMGWEPFLHLASAADAWRLWKGGEPYLFSKVGRPKSLGQLRSVVDRASFRAELQDGLQDPKVMAQLKALIGAGCPRPTQDPAVLEGAVRALRGTLGGTPPPGNQTPARGGPVAGGYVRDPMVIRWVLDRADGLCELCGRQAPFLRPSGEPFLEVHHVIPLAESGPDTVENARALCPNCHREIHWGVMGPTLRGTLQAR